ncbi:MAG: T9SS type A sorting domain-containing protein [Bacteroidales bacterium]|jgi:hypothetical protein|nr:T9SS type A sorting domain-containing protein [Bacteroidales bacterium]
MKKIMSIALAIILGGCVLHAGVGTLKSVPQTKVPEAAQKKLWQGAATEKTVNAARTVNFAKTADFAKTVNAAKTISSARTVGFANQQNVAPVAKKVPTGPVTNATSGRLKLKSVTPSKDANSATITLTAGDVWGDGTGFLLLISNGFEDAYYVDDFFAAAAYKIPTDATLSVNSSVVINNSVSINIPGGAYDYAIFNPDPYYNSFYVPANYSGYSYNFRNGLTYVFEVSYSYDVGDANVGLAVYDESGDLAILPDLSIVGLDVSESSAELTATESVTVRMTNLGERAFKSADLYLQVDNDTAISETYTCVSNDSVELGEVVSYTFTATADLSAVGTHTIKVWAVLADDLRASNDVLSITRIQTTPRALPFFDSLTEGHPNWVVIDKNGGSTWELWQGNVVDAEGDEEGWGFIYQYESDQGADDYIRSISPFIFEAGDYSVSFKHSVAMGIYPESFRVLYGTSPDPATMTEIFSYESTIATYIRTAANFTVTTPGNYYVAIQATSEADMFALFIDDIGIQAGHIDLIPDVTILQLSIDAYSSCVLPEELPVTAYIGNYGWVGSNISSFDLAYKIDNGEWISLPTTAVDIPAGDYVELGGEFDVDFSALGVHTVTMAVSCAGQTDLTNDTAVASIENVAPVTTLPFASDFAEPSDIANWTPWGGWYYDGYSYYPGEDDMPLVSRCLELSAGTYKLSHNFLAGIDYWGDIYTQGFYVAIGEAGSDISTWTTIVEHTELYTNDVDTTEEIIFDVEAAGTYTLGYVSTLTNYLDLYGVTLSLEEGVANENVKTAASVQLSPNPAKNVATVSSNGGNIKEIAVSNAVGKTVYRANGVNAATASINTSSFSQGLYLVRLTTEQEVKTLKMMVVK